VVKPLTRIKRDVVQFPAVVEVGKVANNGQPGKEGGYPDETIIERRPWETEMDSNHDSAEGLEGNKRSQKESVIC